MSSTEFQVVIEISRLIITTFILIVICDCLKFAAGTTSFSVPSSVLLIPHFLKGFVIVSCFIVHASS